MSLQALAAYHKYLELVIKTMELISKRYGIAEESLGSYENMRSSISTSQIEQKIDNIYVRRSLEKLTKYSFDMASMEAIMALNEANLVDFDVATSYYAEALELAKDDDDEEFEEFIIAFVSNIKDHLDKFTYENPQFERIKEDVCETEEEVLIEGGSEPPSLFYEYA